MCTHLMHVQPLACCGIQVFSVVTCEGRVGEGGTSASCRGRGRGGGRGRALVGGGVTTGLRYLLECRSSTGTGSGRSSAAGWCCCSASMFSVLYIKK